jgi:hypothetical protein
MVKHVDLHFKLINITLHLISAKSVHHLRHTISRTTISNYLHFRRVLVIVQSLTEEAY